VLPGTDLVVCDELDFGAIAAAQKARIPVAVVAVIASGALVRPERLNDELDALRLYLGVSEPIRPHGDFFIVPFHPSVRDPDHPAPAETLWMRPEAGTTPHPDGSIVATLGTEFNTESGDLFDRILTALAMIDAPATVAVGRDLDPARFGVQPAHVHVAQYVDFDIVIPHARAVLHHGGSGLFLRSVLGGAPQVVFPMGADQPFTADRVRRMGLGRVLDPITATPEAIVEAVAGLETDEHTRRQVSVLRSSTLALPEPRAVVERIRTAIR
jgi:UDP:flavonoid glycosyltransferase YjiC (YdhE family)